MVLEVAMLMVKSGLEQAFETSFRQASLLIASMPGYDSHELHQCLEVPGKYLLLVRWKTLEDHIIVFLESPIYQKWKQMLHHFYDPFPTVEHFTEVVSRKH